MTRFFTADEIRLDAQRENHTRHKKNTKIRLVRKKGLKDDGSMIITILQNKMGNDSSGTT